MKHLQLLMLVICHCLVRAENVQTEAECKNNDGKIVPCQTSEEHIKLLTRALTYGTSIDQRLAPNSYSAEVVKLGGWNNDWLRDYTKTFEELNPTLTFDRKGKSPVTLKADDIYKFRNLIGTNGRLINLLDGAEKIVFLAHGYWSGDSDGCTAGTADWLGEMAQNIQNAEGQKVVTVFLCWNSDLLETLYQESPFGRSGRQSRFDIFSSVSTACEAYYVSALGFPTPYYYCASSTGKLGELLGGVMRVINEETSISYFHGIGHSLGAHIMGNVWNFGRFKMDRISGLDPAGPCFNENTGDIEIEGNRWGLHKNAANFVDNYHTDGDYYGTTILKGHLNLYAGKYSGYGAGLQPTCSSCLKACCHSKAHQYYTKSIDIGQDYDRFSTYYPMKCAKRESGYLTDECRKIGQPDDSKFTNVGYHAEASGRDRTMFLPIAESNNGYCWRGPNEIEWNCL